MAKLFYVGAPPLSALLETDALAALRNAGRAEDHAAGDLLYRRGESDCSMVFIDSGEIELGNFDTAGKFQPTARFGAGYCFGESAMLSGLARTFSARAVTASSVVSCDAECYRVVVAEHPAIAAAVTHVMAQRLQLLLEFVDDLRTQPFNVQLAKALLNVSGNHEFEAAVAAGTEELAVMLGASPVAVTQALGRLERERLVLRTPDGVRVHDRGLLTQWIQRRTARAPVMAADAGPAEMPRAQ
ncbi:Crp/Fnr family transcriptional regulator [Stakelama tenebrarum]|uniref:Crp/Fnr family transcriptional regulator n=1 Tax=Stakelama tenebrarum TaxID=2711215 RepID=A0A6G6Y930_9SPHN|nr:Crp/Fnr family transcriptional regulator [Sphingosinithalassobacter tenebrarum]QIG81218.1 Crp/Fnr family transcriptional regulator [Sphingosinithalassobacter tenebrarum]